MEVIWLGFPGELLYILFNVAVAAREIQVDNRNLKPTNRLGGMNRRKMKGDKNVDRRSDVPEETNPKSNKDKVSSCRRMVKRGCFGVYPEALAKPEWCSRGTRHVAEIPETSGVTTGGIAKVRNRGAVESYR